MLRDQVSLSSSEQSAPTEVESDEELATQGDTDSFVILYRRHLKAVYSYTYARLINRQEAEDVTSIAFQRAWQSLPNYHPTGPFKSWLFTIVRRALTDYRRQRKPYPVPLGILADVLQDPTIGPEEAALLSEQMRLVLEIISALNREQQEIITLRFMAGLRYAEIAQVIGKREATIKMIAYRAIDEVRRRYDDVQE